MKKLHYFDLEQLQQKKNLPSNRKSCLFAKYFPKYQNKFVLTTKNAAIKAKVKRAKIIKNFQTISKFQNRPHWRRLLANKMKSVKTLNNSTESPEQFAEKLKYFSGLKSAKILLLRLSKSVFNRPPDNHDEFYLLKAFKNIGRVLSLEHLEISPLSIDSKEILPRINAQKQLMDSLKTLTFVFDWRSASDSDLSELIENNKNLLRNVTHLHLSTLYSHFHFESFQRLGELCPKVSTLSFRFSCQEVIYHFYAPRRFSNERFEVKTNYLQTLKAFQHLKILNLSIADVFTFLKDFALPASIESLRLDFDECLCDEILLKIENNLTVSSEEELSKMFEENSLLVRFYDSFKELDHLKALELLFNMEESYKRAYKYQNYLFQSLLKRISSPLKSLKMNPNARSKNYHETHLAQDSSLPQFIKSCESFSSTLETISFGSQKATFSEFDLGAYQNKFINLSEIDMKASFSQSPEKIGSFLQNFISLNESITLITLEAAFNTNHPKPWLALLEQLSQLRKTDKLKIALKLGLIKSKEIEESYMGWIDAMRELKNNTGCYPKMRGIFLSTSAQCSTSSQFLMFLTVYKQKFETGKIL